MRLMKFVLFLVCLFVAFSPEFSVARTVYCTNCSDRFTQALERTTSLQQLNTLLHEYDEAVTQTAQQIRMVQQNIEQYANMVQNTLSLPNDMLSRLRGSFTRLADLTRELKTMRGDVGGLSAVFREVYRERGMMGELMLEGSEKIHAQVDTWGENVDRAAEATFQLSGAQLEAMEQSDLEQHIESLLSTPEGQMQALQAGNTLAALQVQETRQLRELMATVAQSNLASQMKDEKAEQLSEELWRRATDTTGLEDFVNYKVINPF